MLLQIPTDTITAAIDLLKQSHFTQAQQEQIESTITAIAAHRHWNRDRAALWLHQQAFS